MRHRLLLILWIVSDLAFFVELYALAYFIRVGFVFSNAFPFAPFIRVAAIVSPIWLLVLITTRTFTLTRNQWTLRNGAYIAYAALVGVSLFSLAFYFLYKDTYQGLSRLLLLEAFVLTSVLVWGWHILFDLLKRILLRRDPPSFPTLIVGATREARLLLERMEESRNPLKPVAILDARGVKETSIAGVPVRGKLDKLEDILASEGITHLIQTSDLEQTINLLSACRKRGITYMLLPSVLGIVEKDGRVDMLEDLPVTVVTPKRGLLGV